MTVATLEDLRNSSNPVQEMQNIIQELQETEDEEILKPSTDDVYNQKIQLPNEPSGNVNVNGHWVHPLYARINNMLVEGQSPIIIIVGKEGYGKSMTALILCHYLHDKLNLLRGSFNPENQTIYNVIEFLMTERASARKAIMFDEANETLNINEYHSKMNKAVASALRTQRKRQNVHIFVCPEYKKLDSRVREKVDILIDMKGKQFANVKSYRLKHGKRSNRGLDYGYTKYPSWVIPDIDPNLKQVYDKIDDQFKGGFMVDLLIQVLNEKLQEIEEQQTGTV